MIQKINKNNFAAILILAIILYHSFAYLLFYFPAKYVIKKVVQSSIHTEKPEINFVVLAFDRSKLNSNKYNFVWEEENEEFKFENHLYDIKNKVVKGDSVYFSCYLDEDENLLDRIFNEISENNKKDKSQIEFFSLSLVGLYFEEIDPLVFYNDHKSALYYMRIERKNTNFISDIPTPPPRFLV